MKGPGQQWHVPDARPFLCGPHPRAPSLQAACIQGTQVVQLLFRNMPHIWGLALPSILYLPF